MFSTNVPVIADAFFDRDQEIRQLEQLLERLVGGSPSWLAILGPRKIGKTSLLLELERRSATAVVFVLLDTFEEYPLSLEIFRRFAARLLDAVFSREVGLSLEALTRRPAEYRAALLRSERFGSLPLPLRSTILELPERPTDPALIEDAIRLPERLAEALSLHILVAWDEFQELAALGSRRKGADPLPLMRSAWQRHRRVSYVVSGSERSMLSELVTSERSPFFQHFSLMELRPFSEEEAVTLLVRSAPPDRPIPEPLARRAVEVLGGHPFYLQLLGEEFTSSPPPYDEGALKQSLQELLFSPTGRLALYLEKSWRSLVGNSTYLAAVLRAVAEGPCRLSDLARAIDAPTGSTVRYLERVQEAVERTAEGTYRLVDPTFGLWLRWREPGGTVVPMRVVGDEAELRVAEHLALMGFDLIYQARASRGAFDLLATRRGRQIGLQVKRSPLPLRFERAAWSRMEAEARRLGWRWVLVAVTPPPATKIHVLDPARARVGQEIRVDEGASIENLLLWLDS